MQGIGRFREGHWEQILPPKGDPMPWCVYDLMEGQDGSIWAGTAWGALRLKNGRATLYTTVGRAADLKERCAWLP
jgi:hypothetical protein